MDITITQISVSKTAAYMLEFSVFVATYALFLVKFSRKDLLCAKYSTFRNSTPVQRPAKLKSKYGEAMLLRKYETDWGGGGRRYCEYKYFQVL